MSAEARKTVILSNHRRFTPLKNAALQAGCLRSSRSAVTNATFRKHLNSYFEKNLEFAAVFFRFGTY